MAGVAPVLTGVHEGEQGRRDPRQGDRVGPCEAAQDSIDYVHAVLALKADPFARRVVTVAALAVLATLPETGQTA